MSEIATLPAPFNTPFLTPNSSSANWGLWFYSPTLIITANSTRDITLSLSSTSFLASRDVGDKNDQGDSVTLPLYVEVKYYDGTKEIDNFQYILGDGDIDVHIDGGSQGVVDQIAVRARTDGPLPQNVDLISSVKFTFQAPSPGDNGLYEVGLFDSITSIAKQFDVSVQVLENINSVFADSALKNEVLASSGFVHVPTSAVYPLNGDSGISATLPSLSSAYTYVLDTSGVYTVGASPSGANGGALIIDEPNASGHFATFAAGTYSGAGIEGSNGDIDVGLVAPFSSSDGFHANAAGVGVLTFNPSTGAGKVTLPDGFVVPVPAGIAANITDPVEAPNQVLLDYLSQLGVQISETQLDEENFEYLNPTGAAYNVTGSVGNALDNNTEFPVYYTPPVNMPGAVIDGQATATGSAFDEATQTYITTTLPAINILNASEDISSDTISNVQTLEVNTIITLTATQFSSFKSITGGGTITVSTAGTVNLGASNVDPNATFFDLVASDLEGTTLIGSDLNGQTLTASSLGNDTLIAGNGKADVLVGGVGDDVMTGGGGGDSFDLGSGVETIQGGSGDDKFILGGTVAPGTSIVGGGGNDTLEDGSGRQDITGISISGVQTLAASVTLNIAELGEFSNIIAAPVVTDTASNIEAGLGLLTRDAKSVDDITSSDGPVTLSVESYLNNQAAVDEIVGGVQISDTAANIESGLASLESTDLGHIISVAPTDTTPDVSIATYWANPQVIAAIAGGVEISDTAANIANALNALESEFGLNNGNVVSITATDAPVVASVDTLQDYPLVLEDISGGFSISDAAGFVAGNLSLLEAAASAGALTSIKFTDSGTPTFSIPIGDLALDGAAIAAIKSPYILQTTGVLAATADITGIGESDILWRNTDDDTYLWNSNGCRREAC